MLQTAGILGTYRQASAQTRGWTNPYATNQTTSETRVGQRAERGLDTANEMHNASNDVELICSQSTTFTADLVHLIPGGDAKTVGGQGGAPGVPLAP